jgi:hypothetical protein
MNIDRVAVPAKPDVLEHVQAGKGIAILPKLRRNVQEIARMEDNTWNSSRQRPDVQNFNFTKTGYVRNETVYPRAKVDMLDGVLLEDFLRDVEILMKIVSASNAAGTIEIMQARKISPYFPRFPRSDVHFCDLTVIGPETPQSFRTRVKCGWI